MSTSRIVALLPLALVLASCGESGERESRPIEMMFFVEGATGSNFTVKNMRTAAGAHFAMETELIGPYFFILENATHPVSATFTAASEGMRVTLAQGTNPIRSKVELPIGCQVTVTTEGLSTTCCPTATEPCSSAPQQPPENEIRIDVRGQIGESTPECGEELSACAAIPFTATVGDQLASNLTSCIIAGVHDALGDTCFTPATFLIEDPQGFASAVFTRANLQSSDVVLRADLFHEGIRQDSDSSNGQVVVFTDI